MTLPHYKQAHTRVSQFGHHAHRHTHTCSTRDPTAHTDIHTPVSSYADTHTHSLSFSHTGGHVTLPYHLHRHTRGSPNADTKHTHTLSFYVCLSQEGMRPYHTIRTDTHPCLPTSHMSHGVQHSQKELLPIVT